MPLFAQDELGMSPAGIGVVFSIAVAVEFLVLFPAGSFADRFGRKAVMVPSLAGLVVMIAVLGLSTSAVMLTVLLSILCVASGFAGVPPAAMLSDVVPTEHSGRGVGAFRFAGDLGFLFGPLIAGYSSDWFGFKTAFVLAAVPSAIVLVMVIRTAETLKRPIGKETA
jgi:MFS family permease